MDEDVWESARAKRVLQELLRRAAAGDDPELAGLAEDVLAGRHELRDVAYTSAYAEVYLERWQPLLDRWERMPERDRDAAAAHAPRYAEEVLRHLEEHLLSGGGEA